MSPLPVTWQISTDIRDDMSIVDMLSQNLEQINDKTTFIFHIILAMYPTWYYQILFISKAKIRHISGDFAIITMIYLAFTNGILLFDLHHTITDYCTTTSYVIICKKRCDCPPSLSLVLLEKVTCSIASSFL